MCLSLDNNCLIINPEQAWRLQPSKYNVFAGRASPDGERDTRPPFPAARQAPGWQQPVLQLSMIRRPLVTTASTFSRLRLSFGIIRWAGPSSPQWERLRPAFSFTMTNARRARGSTPYRRIPRSSPCSSHGSHVPEAAVGLGERGSDLSHTCPPLCGLHAGARQGGRKAHRQCALAASPFLGAALRLPLPQSPRRCVLPL